MKTICEHVREKNLLVADGGWGTMLMAAGLQTGECPEKWNLERPEVVREVGRAYAGAGAELLTTNSFGGSRLKLAQYGLEERAAEINETAAALSREAAGDAAHVMASIGPTGKFLMMGDVTEEELYEAFREQAQALERGGADAALVETMSDIAEAACAVRAVKDHTGLEIICTFTYSSESDGVHRTMMGVSPAEMARAILDAGATVIGANCSFGPKEMVPVVGELRAAAPDVPILVNPNAGQPVNTEEGVVYPETPEGFAAYTEPFFNAGANIVGGCCGTTPEHIKAVRAKADALR